LYPYCLITIKDPDISGFQGIIKRKCYSISNKNQVMSEGKNYGMNGGTFPGDER
jgi:hypothetical protein